MLHDVGLDEEFFARLVVLDQQMAREVAALGCGFCGGPLHQSNYERKPRGGCLAGAGERYRVRFSLCCGRRGCRRRTTPPSLRFLGRKVYLEAAVVVACIYAMTVRTAGAVGRATGIAARTVRRWTSWWRSVFPSTRCWRSLMGRFAPPPPEVARLPASLAERLDESLGPAVLMQLARLLSPVTSMFCEGAGSPAQLTQKMALLGCYGDRLG